MAVYVNTNYSALQGQRYLGNVQNQLTTTYQRLSSGMRINSAKDDAAGLQIADRLTSQINGLNQGNRNASDGIALAQTAEAGMDEISGMLQKIRTLAVQANNGTNTLSRGTIEHIEQTNILESAMAVYVNTNYSALQGQRYLGNVQNQLTTTYQRLSSGMRINSAKDDAAGLQIADRLTSQINGLNQGNRNASDGIALAQTAEAGMDEISGMLQKIRTLAVQANNGTNTLADKQALSKEASSLATEITRIAKQTTFAGKTILNGKQTNSIDPIGGGGGGGPAPQPPQPPQPAPGGGGAGSDQSITLQVGSNKGDTIGFKLVNLQFSAAAKAAGIAETEFVANAAGGDKGFIKGADGAITVNFSGASEKVIEFMDKMIGYVDSQRADLGAIQNRLESSIRNQSNVAANEADARSRIRDADFAEESANLTQQNIIQQAASSMLMQANTRPQLGLSLLG